MAEKHEVNESRAVTRIRRAEVAMRDYKNKVYRLRRIVAGDTEALYSKSVGINQDTGRDQARQFGDEYPPILIQQFEEGRNNDLLLLLGVLVEQTCYQFPNIEVRNVTPHQQVVQSQYLRTRLMECNAIEHNKIALWDHLMGGCGDVYICVDDDKPIVQWADALDIRFDQTARLVCDVRWKSHTVCQPLWYWMEMFNDNDAFNEMLAQVSRDPKGRFQSKSPNLDLPFELEFYYDVEDGDGHYMVFAKSSDNEWADKAVYKGKNPNFFDYYGERRPYLPYESIFYSTLPSVRLPQGKAEMALPAQIAVWRAAKRIQRIIDHGPAFYEIVKGMSIEDKKSFMEAMLAGVVEVDDSHFNKIKEHAPLPITPTDVEELNRNQQALKTQLGASSYSLGQPEKGVKYAREVNAIQAEGSLTAGSIAKDNSAHWSRWVPKFCRRGQLHDKRVFVARIPTESPTGPSSIEYVFNSKDPIRPYLVPNAEMIISEDAMRFVPQQVKAAQAREVLATAIELAAQYPGGVGPAYRKFLEAAGVENIEERLKPPTMALGAAPGSAPMPGQAALPGGVESAA